MRIVLLGPPGAGKGTQAERLAQRFDVPTVSTGDIFEQQMGEHTDLGREAEDYVDRGELVPDDVVVGMVRERLGQDDARAGFVLDGFPRTVAQAEALDRLLDDTGTALDAVAYLEVPDDVVLERIAARAEQQHRPDDTDETARHRLQVFLEQTEPLVEYYRKAGTLVPVEGTGPVEAVAGRLADAIAAAPRRD